MGSEKKFIAVVVVAVLFAVLAVGLGTQASKLKKENAQLSSQLASVQDDNRKLQDQVNRLVGELATVRSDYASLETENERLKARGGKTTSRRAGPQ